jgi:hypothetical protein
MFLSLAQDELSALRLLSDFAATLGWGARSAAAPCTPTRSRFGTRSLTASIDPKVTTTPATVVPIAVSAGSRAAAAYTSPLQALSASRTLSSLLA